MSEIFSPLFGLFCLMVFCHFILDMSPPFITCYEKRLRARMGVNGYDSKSKLIMKVPSGFSNVYKAIFQCPEKGFFGALIKRRDGEDGGGYCGYFYSIDEAVDWLATERPHGRTFAKLIKLAKFNDKAKRMVEEIKEKAKKEIY